MKTSNLNYEIDIVIFIIARINFDTIQWYYISIESIFIRETMVYY